MDKRLRIAGLMVVLGLFLGLGNWQRRGEAAGQLGNAMNGLPAPAVASAPQASRVPQKPAAAASTITVTNTGDGAATAANCPGPNCRLRDAIAKAVAGDTVDFSVTGTITLNSGELGIGKNLTITGPGANLLTISGNNAGRVFNISIGFTVALSGLTITGGNNDLGGAIRNDGNLTLTNCTISANASDSDGGGLYKFSGTMNARNTIIGRNTAIIGGPDVSGNITS